MDRRLRPLALACTLTCTLAPRLALAVDETPGARLAWVRAEGADACPAGDEVAASVVRLLGRDPFRAPAAQEIEVLVERPDGHWRARLYLRGEDHALTGAREIVDDSPGCEGLATAVALAVALGIDPTTRPPPPPSTPPPTRPPRRPMSPRSTSGGGAVAFGLYGQVGLIPGSNFGVELAAEPLARGSFRLLVGAIFLPDTRAARPGGDVAFGATALSVAGCFDLIGGARASLSACAAVSGGAVHAVAVDLAAAAPTQRGWFGAGASLRLGVRLAGPLFAEARVDATGLPVRVQFNLQGAADPVYEQSPVALGGFVGLGLSFR